MESFTHAALMVRTRTGQVVHSNAAAARLLQVIHIDDLDDVVVGECFCFPDSMFNQYFFFFFFFLKEFFFFFFFWSC